MPDPAQYVQNVLNARRGAGALSPAAIATIDGEYLLMLQQILLLAETNPGTFHAARAEEVTRSIRAAMREYGSKFDLEAKKYVDRAMELGVNGHLKGLDAVDLGSIAAKLGFDKVPGQTLQAIAARRGVGIADAFMTFRTKNVKAVIDRMDSVIFQAIGQGMKSSDFVRSIAFNLGANLEDQDMRTLLSNLGERGSFRAFLNAEQRQALINQFGDRLDEAKALLSDARRIGVTEVNTAYFEADRLSAVRSPVVGGVRWNLSGRHDAIGIVDECDVYASADYYDLGVGIFPAEVCPARPHPYCACWLESVLRPASEWGKEKQAFVPPKELPAEEIQQLMEERAKMMQARTSKTIRIPDLKKAQKVQMRSNAYAKNAYVAGADTKWVPPPTQVQLEAFPSSLSLVEKGQRARGGIPPVWQPVMQNETAHEWASHSVFRGRRFYVQENIVSKAKIEGTKLRRTLDDKHPGIRASTDKAAMKAKGNGSVVEVMVDVRNPLQVNEKFWGGVSGRDAHQQVYELLRQKGINPLSATRTQLSEAVQKAGYDGWYVMHGDDVIHELKVFARKQATVLSDDWKPLQLASSTTGPDDLRFVQDLGGSTGAKLYERVGDGKKFVVKKGASKAHITEESIADRVYARLQISVPDHRVYTVGDEIYKVSEFIEGANIMTLAEARASSEVSKQALQVIQDRLRKHFAADALLGNWDVVGLNFDNLLVDVKTGRVWRIDNGGALRFRTQGGAKTLTPDVQEIFTLRDASINPSAAEMFGTLSDRRLKKDAASILRRRKQILEELPPELRGIMTQRMDWLEDWISGGSSFQGSADDVGGVIAREVNKVFAEKVRSLGARGYSILFDEGDVEDLQALVWWETNLEGKKVVRMRFKVTEEAAERILPKGAIANNETKDLIDQAFQHIQAAAKTVATHADDGKYNLGTIAKAEDFLLNDLRGKIGKSISQKDYEVLLGQLIDIKDAKDAGTKPPFINKIVSTFKAPKDKAVWVKWSKGEMTLRRKQAKAGTLKESSETNIHDVNAFRTVSKDGVRIEISPFDRSSTGQYAFGGNVEISFTGDVSEASIRTIFNALGEVGINAVPASDEYLEAVYLFKHFEFQSAEVRNIARQALTNQSIPIELRAEELRNLFEQHFDVKLPLKAGQQASNGATYDWRGLVHDRGGWGEWKRVDIPPDAFKGLSLVHGSSQSVEDLVKLLLEQTNGFLTSTVERTRLGVPLKHGMSVGSDIEHGTADYLFTRIKTQLGSRGATFQWDASEHLTRLDARSYSSDWLGGSYKIWKSSERRAKSAADIRALARNGGNETLLKKGIDLFRGLQSIGVGSHHDKEQLISLLQDVGITKINGKTLEQIIIVR
jgi:hypothetical protein